MRKIIFLFIIGLSFLSCADDNNSSSSIPADEQLSTGPEAKSEYDASSYGVYKGIFIGSSGTVYVNIYNNGLVSAKMKINDVDYNYTTTESVSEGQPITGLTFTSGSSSFDFSVDADGENPTIDNLNISGHPNPYAQILKEYSFEHIKCYLGTFSGDDSGVFNIATTSNPETPNDNYTLGLAVPTGEINAIYLDGIVSGTSISGTFEGGTFSGTISKNTMSGNWQNETLQSGSWTATRKL
ncbi:MAG TPA: hypothetical protein VLB74_03045 [Flavobacterium sp.]|uniref:hypothetical protein n=1 Tax=Flavobacterium sp. TaxID=239 RepID=UPI002BB3F2CA|nr:hypothetical protein [Flavobacterium sp.]HSD13605.1 hypothetical protein [Flavobacterium sp.]